MRLRQAWGQFLRECCQMRMTFHPCRRSWLVTRRSRAMLMLLPLASSALRAAQEAQSNRTSLEVPCCRVGRGWGSGCWSTRGSGANGLCRQAPECQSPLDLNYRPDPFCFLRSAPSSISPTACSPISCAPTSSARSTARHRVWIPPCCGRDASSRTAISDASPPRKPASCPFTSTNNSSRPTTTPWPKSSPAPGSAKKPRAWSASPRDRNQQSGFHRIFDILCNLS